MSDIRKAIMSRLGEFARPGAKAKMGTVSVNTSASTADLLTEVQRLRDKIKTSGSDFDKSLLEMVKKELERRGVAMMSRPGAKARFEENCGTGAGGFKPGNKCGADDGTGGGGAPEAKKRKRKPKRTPLAGPKVEKPAKIPSVQALEDMAVSSQPHHRWDWEAAEDVLSGRTDPQAKALLNEMSALVKRWDELTDVITEMEWGPSRKNRSATKRKATADELNRLQQRAKRIIRDAQKTEKTAKRSRVEQAGELIGQTIKAQDSIAFYEALEDVRSAIDEARKRGGAGSGKMRKSLKAMEEEWRGLQREVEVINADYIDMKEKQPDNEQEARELKQRAGQLLQKTGDWRKRAQELVKQVKAQASRTGDRQLFALAVRAQKILAHRPGVKAQMGLLDRLGTVATAAVSAATAKPFDPTNPQVAKDLEAAKRAAITEVNNYKFFKEFNDAQFRALDDYVKATAKSIAGLRSSQDVARLTNGIKQAVAARNLIRKTLKTPFSRSGAKAAFDRRIEVDHWTSPKGTKYVAGVHERGGGTSFQPFISATYSDGGEQLMTGNAPTFKTEKGARKWLDTEIGRRKSVSSRPGAKATAAKPERKAKNCTVDAKPLAYGKGDDALEREDVKAGLKLMEKADPKVSEKIRTLIKEGKPQDQAVAIALDMKRRGEL